MDEQIRTDIAENYGAECWQSITGKLYPATDESFRLFKFDRDVEHNGKTYRCVIVQKVVYDGHTEDIDYAEDLFAEAWQI